MLPVISQEHNHIVVEFLHDVKSSKAGSHNILGLRKGNLGWGVVNQGGVNGLVVL